MAKKMINTMHVEGYLYQHNLEEKVTGPNSKTPNTPYIRGEVEIATDEAMTNIIKVNFSYVTPTNKNGTNPTYTMLRNIIDKKLFSVMENGKELAAKLRIDGDININEFPTRTGEYVVNQINRGSFIRTTNLLASDEHARMNFDCDILITKIKHKDADTERNIPEKAEIEAYAFTYKNELLPVKFVAVTPGAISYFESLEVTNSTPFATHIRGTQINQTVVRRIESENAWGGIEVREVPSSIREYVITWAAREPDEFGNESFMTKEEFDSALALRETVISTNKARYAENQEAAPTAFNTATSTPKSTTPSSVYDF